MRRQIRPRGTRKSAELGAAAVEFALILPIFLALVLGIVEFGRAFSIQVSMAEGAREAARYSAIHYADAGYTNVVAQQKAIDAAPIASLKLTDVTISSCAPGTDSIVTISAKTKYLTGLPTLVPFLPDIMSISAKGVMQCGG